MSNLEFIESKGFSLVLSVNGDYYRLVGPNGVLVLDDAANEDMYDIDMAACVACDIVKSIVNY